MKKKRKSESVSSCQSRVEGRRCRSERKREVREGVVNRGHSDSFDQIILARLIFLCLRVIDSEAKKIVPKIKTATNKLEWW